MNSTDPGNSSFSATRLLATPQQHRHVRVVTASVHHTHILAPVLGGRS